MFARLTDPIEIVSIHSDAPYYESGVDDAQLTVLTRRNSGEGLISLSLDLHPSAGPTFHVGEDAFTINPGETHESVFNWPVPDSSYVFECDADVSVEDGTRALWHRIVSSLFTAVLIRPHEVVEYMDLVLNCQQLDPETECLYAIRAALPPYATPAAVGLYYQNMCRAEAFYKRGDRARGNAAWNAGIMVPFKLTLGFLAGFAGTVEWKLATANAFHDSGIGAITCMTSSMYYAGGGGGGGGSGGDLRDVETGAFVDSMAVWMVAGIDSTENDIADVFLVEGECISRIEADGNWTSADSIGLVSALVLPLDDLGSITTVSRHAHNFQHSEDSNPHSANTWRLASRADQTINIGVLHENADSSRAFLGAISSGASGPAIRLAQNRPNPFGRETGFWFELAKPGRAIVSIFDAGGRLIAQPFDRSVPPGRYFVAWDGRTSKGREISAGVYFYRLA
jgi:hypothetical protein